VEIETRVITGYCGAGGGWLFETRAKHAKDIRQQYSFQNAQEAIDKKSMLRKCSRKNKKQRKDSNN